ncbi:MAG: glutathione S-transferase [Leptolyngbyaceae cyanobacterium CSU_1_3]|nr:glutathione S-transferase [Leptolyngbyaceae cyanobacterium CSU_1_3]
MIPISTLFIGLNGLVAIALSYIVVMERIRTRVWHGESQEDATTQPDYLENPTQWAAFIEQIAQKTVISKSSDDGLLQRKVRAHANFTEYVPIALLFLIALEWMKAAPWLVWSLGGTLTVARIAYAWGVIQIYGPSPGRAIGFFGTWFVYIAGSLACLYYGIKGL